jgi:hypothetical protein
MNKITIRTNEGLFYFDMDSTNSLEYHIAGRLASKQGKTCWKRMSDDGRCDTSRYFSVAIGTPQNGGLSNTTTLYFSIPFTEYAKIRRAKEEEIKNEIHEIDEELVMLSYQRLHGKCLMSMKYVKGLEDERDRLLGRRFI